MFLWTQLHDTPLWTAAKAQYDSNPLRFFHDFSHVGRLYHHAAVTYGFAYDLDLDKAILAHDVIYDDAPEKELRSADWLMLHDPDPSEAAYAHIMRTARHQVGTDNRILLLDLADLGDMSRVASDRDRLEAETCALTGCSRQDFARGNSSFLESLIRNFQDDKIVGRPGWEVRAFRAIRAGAEYSLSLSEYILRTKAS